MERVFDATQLQRLSMDKEANKPHCLIIDEIDGTQESEGRSAIKALVDYVTGKGGRRQRAKKVASEDDAKEEPGEEKPDRKGGEVEDLDKDLNMEKPENSDEDDDEGIATAKKTKKPVNMVKRPIICICNDMYGKSMAQLRKVAVVFSVKCMDAARMTASLRSVCLKEHVSVGSDLISALCKQSKYDMRSCLNTLQLAAAQTTDQVYRTITKDQLFAKGSNAVLNSKDAFQGIFDVWSEICGCAGDKEKRTVKYVRGLIMRHENPGFLLDGLYQNCLTNGTGDIYAVADFLVRFV